VLITDLDPIERRVLPRFTSISSTNSYTESSFFCRARTYPVDDDLPLTPKYLGETIMPMQPRPTEVEIQYFPAGELDDADGIVGIVRLGEFWVTDGETCGEDPLQSGNIVGIAGVGDAGGETEQPPGHVDIVDSAIHYQPAGSFGEFDKEACEVHQLTTIGPPAQLRSTDHRPNAHLL
jgi:hypothetical protein